MSSPISHDFFNIYKLTGSLWCGGVWYDGNGVSAVFALANARSNPAAADTGEDCWLFSGVDASAGGSGEWPPIFEDDGITVSSAEVTSESPEFKRVLLRCWGCEFCEVLLDALPRPLRLKKCIL